MRIKPRPVSHSNTRATSLTRLVPPIKIKNPGRSCQDGKDTLRRTTSRFCTLSDSLIWKKWLGLGMETDLRESISAGTYWGLCFRWCADIYNEISARHAEIRTETWVSEGRNDRMGWVSSLEVVKDAMKGFDVKTNRIKNRRGTRTEPCGTPVKKTRGNKWKFSPWHKETWIVVTETDVCICTLGSSSQYVCQRAKKRKVDHRTLFFFFFFFASTTNWPTGRSLIGRQRLSLRTCDAYLCLQRALRYHHRCQACPLRPGRGSARELPQASAARSVLTGLKLSSGVGREGGGGTRGKKIEISKMDVAANDQKSENK